MDGTSIITKKRMALVYDHYHIMVRQNVSVLHKAKQLFQQFLVDAYTAKLKQNVCNSLGMSKKHFCYQDFQHAVVDGDGDPSNVGCRIILLDHQHALVDHVACMNVNRIP